MLRRGWMADESDVGATLALTGYGLYVRVRDEKAPPEHAKAVMKVLGSVDLPARYDIELSMPPELVMLWVGSK